MLMELIPSRCGHTVLYMHVLCWRDKKADVFLSVCCKTCSKLLSLLSFCVDRWSLWVWCSWSLLLFFSSSNSWLCYTTGKKKKTHTLRVSSPYICCSCKNQTFYLPHSLLTDWPWKLSREHSNFQILQVWGSGKEIPMFLNLLPYWLFPLPVAGEFWLINSCLDRGL